MTDAEIDALVAMPDPIGDGYTAIAKCHSGPVRIQAVGVPVYTQAQIIDHARVVVKAALQRRQPMSDELTDKLRAFMDEAAGDGLVLADIDAGDLYMELFPDFYVSLIDKSDGEES